MGICGSKSNKKDKVKRSPPNPMMFSKMNNVVQRSMNTDNDFFETVTGGTEWNSDFFNSMTPVTHGPNTMVTDDPLDMLKLHGGSECEWDFTGNTRVNMTGDYPRMYLLNNLYKNVEATMYYRKYLDEGKGSDGITFGMRGPEDGHLTGGDWTKTNTYYFRIRHDGKIDIAKEQGHSNGYAVMESTQFFTGNMPTQVFIGLKAICYNIDNDTKVRLKLYIDTYSQGIPANYDLDNWELVFDITDEYGAYPAANDNSWNVDVDEPFVDEGMVFIRNGEVYGNSYYKRIYVREIDAPST